MDRDGAIDFAAAPEQAPERELDLGRIAIRCRHAREDLGGVVEAVVDEVIEAHVVIARQANGARGPVAATEKIGGHAHQTEGQRQKHRRQLEHEPETSRLRAALITTRGPTRAPRAIRL